MQSSAQGDPLRFGGLQDGRRAPHCPSGSVECREDADTGQFHDPAAMFSDETFGDLVVIVKEVTPRSCAVMPSRFDNAFDKTAPARGVEARPTILSLAKGRGSSPATGTAGGKRWVGQRSGHQAAPHQEERGRASGTETADTDGRGARQARAKGPAGAQGEGPVQRDAHAHKGEEERGQPARKPGTRGRGTPGFGECRAAVMCSRVQRSVGHGACSGDAAVEGKPGAGDETGVVASEECDCARGLVERAEATHRPVHEPGAQRVRIRLQERALRWGLDGSEQNRGSLCRVGR